MVEAPYSYGTHGNTLVGAYFPLGLGYLRHICDLMGTK